MYGRKLVAFALTLLYIISYVSLAIPQRGTLKIVGTAWIQAPAVSRTPKGYVGALTNITVIVTEGWGDVFISTFSLTEKDFQGAATTAAREAAKLLGLDFRKYNFYFRIKSTAVIVGGPSAGVAMTIAVYAALSGKEVNRSVMVTGMIAPDGTVGPVGGVFEKAQAVAQAGGKVFLVPPGQSVVVQYKTVVKKVGPFRFYSLQPVTIDLKEYAWNNWRLKVVEVSTIEEAISYFFGTKFNETTYKSPVLSEEAVARLKLVWRKLEKKARQQLDEASKLIKESSLSGFVKKQLEAALQKYGWSQYHIAQKTPEGDIGGFEEFKRALASALWIKGLVEYYVSGNLTEYITVLDGKLNNTIEQVEKAGVRNFLDVNFKILAADSVVRAQRYLVVSREKWSSDPQESIYYAGLSYASLEEASCFLDFLPQEGVSEIDMGKIAETYISVARSTWPYVLTVVQETGGTNMLIETAGQYFDLATEFYLKKMYLLALVSSVRSLALSEAAMSYLQLTLSGKTVYLDYSLNQALRILSKTSDNVAGIYFMNMSVLTDSVSDKIALYKLASYMGELSLELASEYETRNTEKQAHPSVETMPGTEVKDGQANKQTPSKGKKTISKDYLTEILDYLRKAWNVIVEREYIYYTLFIVLLIVLLYVVSKKTRQNQVSC